MASLICGSLAYDSIMGFDGKFADHLLPDQLHRISLSFTVPTLRRDFGGCAGNIAWALKLLGGEPLPMGVLGLDGMDYLQRLDGLGIATEHILTVQDAHTAQCMVVTDADSNQIAAFHPGAMARAHENRIDAAFSRRVQLGLIAPDGRQAMLEHAQQMHAAAIPFVFDPGQCLILFDGAELRDFIGRADWVCVNEYEAALLAERTGWSMEAIARQVRGLIVTLAEKGCTVWQPDGPPQAIAPVPATAVLDPTGCGDAFRGALLFGLERGWSLARCAALGNRMGALKIASRGPQNYQLDFVPEDVL